MKKKLTAIMLGIAMTVLMAVNVNLWRSGILITADAQEKETVVYGRVLEIEGDRITIETGSLNYEVLNQPNEPTEPEEDETESLEPKEQERQSLLIRDGGEMIVTVTERTVYKSTADTEGVDASAGVMQSGAIAAFRINGENVVSAAAVMGYEPIIEPEEETESVEPEEEETESIKMGEQETEFI